VCRNNVGGNKRSRICGEVPRHIYHHGAIHSVCRSPNFRQTKDSSKRRDQMNRLCEMKCDSSPLIAQLHKAKRANRECEPVEYVPSVSPSEIITNERSPLRRHPEFDVDHQCHPLDPSCRDARTECFFGRLIDQYLGGPFDTRFSKYFRFALRECYLSPSSTSGDISKGG
jgi:hypothetical protein